MKKDETYLRHVLDAISDVEKFTENVSEQDFFTNKEKQYAVLRALEIIGEATKNLSKELKAKHEEVDWKNIAGMRDKLIHAYFGVNMPLVWKTIKEDLPKLGQQIKKISAALDPVSVFERVAKSGRPVSEVNLHSYEEELADRHKHGLRRSTRKRFRAEST